MENKSTFSLSVGLAILATVVALGTLSWVSGLQYIS